MTRLPLPTCKKAKRDGRLVWAKTDPLDEDLENIPLSIKSGVVIRKGNVSEIHYGSDKKIEINKGGLELIEFIDRNTPITIAKLMINVHDSIQQQTKSFLKDLIGYGILVPASDFTKKKSSARVLWTTVDSPLGFEWLVTGRCNAKCVFCIYERYKSELNELASKEAFNLIKEMSDLGTLAVTLSGGEPFLRTDLLQLVRELRDRNVFVTLITNGYLLDTNSVRSLRNDDVTVKVSIDSMDGNVHDYLRGLPGLQKRVLKGLNLLVSEGVDVEVNTVVTRYNLMGLNKMYGYLKRLDIRKWNISIVRPMGMTRKKWADLYPNLQRYFSYVKKLVNEFLNEECMDITFLFDYKVLKNILDSTADKQILESNRKTGCMIDIKDNSTLTISPQGDVYLCPYLEFTRIGNVRKQSLKELWETSQTNNDFLQLGLRRIDTVCQNCRHLPLCRGGCIAHVHCLRKNIWLCDPIANERGVLFEKLFLSKNY